MFIERPEINLPFLMCHLPLLLLLFAAFVLFYFLNNLLLVWNLSSKARLAGLLALRIYLSPQYWDFKCLQDACLFYMCSEVRLSFVPRLAM